MADVVRLKFRLEGCEDVRCILYVVEKWITDKILKDMVKDLRS